MNSDEYPETVEETQAIESDSEDIPEEDKKDMLSYIWGTLLGWAAGTLWTIYVHWSFIREDPEDPTAFGGLWIVWFLGLMFGQIIGLVLAGLFNFLRSIVYVSRN